MIKKNKNKLLKFCYKSVIKTINDSKSLYKTIMKIDIEKDKEDLENIFENNIEFIIELHNSLKQINRTEDYLTLENELSNIKRYSSKRNIFINNYKNNKLSNIIFLEDYKHD